ncbi:MAG: HlyD family efflux transporter periplasmic adaptor subunit [Clostridia bacterium]|nr:HlyD family efflux transporter periplasmic adaptor subunit [Clostridia bacterium]
MKKTLKVLLITAVVLAVAAGAAYYLLNQSTPLTVDSLDLDTVTIQRGDIQVTAHGTGLLEVDVTRDVYSQVSGRVRAVYKEDGDYVEAGELIAVLESEALEESLRSQTDDLYLRELELSASRLGRAPTVISAPLAGRVKLLRAGRGDDMVTVQTQFGALAVLSTDGRMRINMPTPEGFVIGTLPIEVRVHIGDKVENGSVLTADEHQLTVLIESDLYEPNAIAFVRDMNGAQLGAGELVINKPVVVAGVSGTIKTVEVKENDRVRANDRLFTLEDDSVTVDVERQLLSRDQLRRQLDDTREKITRLEIRAPISGVVAGFMLREGALAQDGQQVCTIIQTDRAKVVLAVDELDIAKIFPGQSAILKLDALPGRTYEATVDRVLPIGARTGDITTYDVVLYLDAQDNMLPYMSVSGDILVAEVKDTLLAPVTALQALGNDRYVMLAPTNADLDGATTGRRRPSGNNGFMMMMGQGNNSDVTLLQSVAPQLMRRVEIGLASGEFVEILEGVREGEQIVLPRSGSNMINAMMRMGGGGGGNRGGNPR